MRLSKIRIVITTCIIIGLMPAKAQSQTTSVQNPIEGTGAWYMYFWNKQIKESNWGLQGDIQYRNWDVIGDLEQLLLRGGVTYKPNDTNVLLTLGYGHITTGEFGSGSTTTTESRIYQEVLMPQKVGSRLYFKHRFRFEQRFVESQDFRTRFRYNLFLNIPLNGTEMAEGAIYLALYNELFINGQKNIGDSKFTELFDRNRFYTGLGYSIKKGMNVQLAYMTQKTNSVSKGQLQLSFHHNF